ncbi:MAG: hypothetical protein Q9183_005298, partial [Haloplaca sp. 2 TL-2023]
FALNYGVFQEYYYSHAPFLNNDRLSIVGTIATGGFFLGAPFMTPLLKHYPRCQRPLVWSGWALTIISLIGASFATTLGALIATQGVIYTIGVTILYWPIMSMMNEWFILRRGLAFGIIAAATGVSGIVMPFALAALLDKYGYPTTLRAMAVAFTVLTGPILPMIKGRLPLSKTVATKSTDFSFLKKPLFYFYALSVLCQGLGHYFPTLYLPLYANSLGYNPSIGALFLALFSLAQVIGQVLVGYLTDRKVSVRFLALILPGVSCIAILTLWGLAKSLSPLIIFALIYGLFAGSYLVLWAQMGMELGDNQNVALTTFGIFAFLKGVGNVITGPIGADLILQGTDIAVYGLEKYTWIVAYCGVCMFVCSMIMVPLFFKAVRGKVYR